MDKKLLLVDDEEGIRKVLGISLSDSGYTVFTAENGEEALKIFLKETPPIVLTDIKMPGMDGIELLQKIKHANPDTEVIMISGHGDMDLAIQSLKYQAIDFVTKPINDDVLEIALNRSHEKIRMRQQLREYTENLEALVRQKSAELIEVERQVAVGQAVEGLSSAMRNIAGDLEGGLTYFNEMPCFVSVHNSKLKIVAVNPLYKERLGDKVGCNSWDVYTAKTGAEFRCPAEQTFKTGKGQRTKATVDTSNGDKAPVIVHTAPIRNQNDKQIVFKINDNGIGMDRETRESLFTLFFSSKGNKGTGLGLFMADKIIDKHGGQISVESKSGQGSSFKISIPQRIPESVKATLEKPASK